MSSIPAYRPVTHIIFDNIAEYGANLWEYCKRNMSFIWKRLPSRCEIKSDGYDWPIGEQNTAKVCINELSLPLTVPEFIAKIDKLVREQILSLQLMKGAERLIIHLNDHNIPYCLATSGGKDATDLKMSTNPNIFKLFTHYVMGSTDPEVKFGKPAPDIFLIAAGRFKDKPDSSKCLVFEDSPNGIKAATMQGVMVPDSIIPPEKRTEATIVLESLADFKPELFGLPKIKE